MSKIIEVEINVGSKSALNNVNDLKSAAIQLEEKLSSSSFGSAEFNRLAAQLKTVRNNLKDFDAALEGLDREQRATAMVDTFQGLVGAVGAVSSAFIAFGADSAAIENAEKKLLGVIGVVNGLRDASNGLVAAGKLFGPTFTAVGDSIKAGFTAGATGAQTFKAALISTGIGAFIVAVGLLVANFDKLTGSAKKSEKAIKDVADAEQGLILALDAENRRDKAIYDQKVQRAKNRKASTTELLNLELEYYQTLLQSGKTTLAALDKTSTDYETKRVQLAERNLTLIDLIELTKLKREGEYLAQSEKANQKSEDKKVAIVNQADNKIVESEADKNAKLLALNKQLLEQELALATKQISDIQTASQKQIAELSTYYDTELKKFRDFNLDQLGELFKTSDVVKFSLDYINKIKETYQKISEEDKKYNTGSAKDTEIRYQKELADLKANALERVVIIEQAQADEIKKFQEARDKIDMTQVDANAQLEALQRSANDIVKAQQDEKLQILEGAAKKEVEIETNKNIAIKQITSETWLQYGKYASDLFGAIQSLEDARLTKVNSMYAEMLNNTKLTEDQRTQILKNQAADQQKIFEENKKYAIAQSITNTLLSIGQIFSNAAANPKSILFPAQPYIEAAIAGAYGYANVRKITNTSFSSGASSAGAGSSSIGSISGGAGGGGSIFNPFSGTGAGGTNILGPRILPPTVKGGSGVQVGLNEGVTGGDIRPVRAYVLAGDITDSQTIETKLRERRQI